MTSHVPPLDYFAGKALPALIARADSSTIGREAEIASRAYALAEAMLGETRARRANYHQPAKVKARNLAKMAPDLLDAVQICVKAEKERARKLKPGSPASTYAGARIDRLEALIIRALAG